MTFVHEDPHFEQLLGIVGRETGIAEALIEKDYWVTHTLWALHETGLDIWFKGGTSLSGDALVVPSVEKDSRRGRTRPASRRPRPPRRPAARGGVRRIAGALDGPPPAGG